MGGREAMPTTLEQLVDIAHNLYISKLLSGVAVTLVVYDWMLVLGDEYDTIYQSRWSLAKGLLLYIRIASPPTLILTAFTLADLRPELSSSFCAVWLYIQTMGFYTSMFAANGLLSLRLMALYRRKRFISWFIAGFFIVTYGLTLGLMIDGLGPVRRDIFYSDVVHTCAVTVSSTIFSAVFYAPAAFELFLFSLTAYSVLKDARLLMAAGVGETCTPFLTVFYRDGILVFLIMAGLRVWNIWIYLTQQVSTYTMGTQLMWAANVVLITRVYMNLCWLAKKPVLTPPENDSAISNEIRTCATVNIFRMRRHDHGQTSYDRGRRGLVSFERWRQDEGLTFHSLESNDRVGMSASVGVSKSPTPRPLNAEKDSAGGVEDAPPVLVASARSPIAIPPPVILAS